MQMRVDVLDHGYVELIDVMGTDAAICDAARVSYGKGTHSVSDDTALIRYLMRHSHTSPFEMCEMKFRVQVPMDCWRQWIRHRTAAVNEYSTRYSEAIDLKYQTDPAAWRLQNPDNKQGSGAYIDDELGQVLSSDERDLHEHAEKVYKTRLAAGVAREQARKDLPLATYTRAIWKIDLHNLLHFLRLRMDPHAQIEIREYACAIGYEFVAHYFPITWTAFLDYHMYSMRLTGPELRVLNDLGKPSIYTAAFEAATRDWNKREREEFRTKMQRLGEFI